MIIDGIETNLRPISETDAWLGDYVYHVKDGDFIPSLLMSIEYNGGNLSPGIQYLNADGDIYPVRSRPEGFEQLMIVNESELMVA